MAAPAASPDSRFSRVRQSRNSPGTGRTDRENRQACTRLASISPLNASGSQSVSTGATIYDLYRAISFAMTYVLTEVLRQVSLTPAAKSGLMRGDGNREMPSKRRTTMKRTTVLAFLTAALISMGSACAHAQAPAFQVPFDFTVDNQVLPAGTYQVSYNAAKTAILIRSQDDRIHALTT